MDKLSDIELIRIARKKGKESDAAFTVFYDRYEKKIYRFIYYNIIDKSVTDDIFQETFIRFLKSFDTEVAYANIQAYLFRIAQNLCINYHKRRKLSDELDLSQLVSPESQDLAKSELYDLIMNAVEILDEKYKAPFIMHEIEGMRYKEIAETLNISWSLAQTRNYRAKKKIIKILKPYIKDLC